MPNSLHVLSKERDSKIDESISNKLKRYHKRHSEIEIPHNMQIGRDWEMLS